MDKIEGSSDEFKFNDSSLKSFTTFLDIYKGQLKRIYNKRTIIDSASAPKSIAMLNFLESKIPSIQAIVISGDQITFFEGNNEVLYEGSRSDFTGDGSPETRDLSDSLTDIYDQMKEPTSIEQKHVLSRIIEIFSRK